MPRSPKAEAVPYSDLDASSRLASDVDAQLTEATHLTEMSNSTGEPRQEPHTTPETTPQSLIERLKAKAEQDRQESEDDFAKLVGQLAREEATENEVTDVLKASGKTLAELEKAVTHQREIIRLKSIVAELPGAESAHRDARAELNAMKEDHKHRVKAMAEELKMASRVVNHTSIRLLRITEAKSELSRLSPVVNEPHTLPPSEALKLRPIHSRNLDWRVA